MHIYVYMGMCDTYKQYVSHSRHSFPYSFVCFVQD